MNKKTMLTALLFTTVLSSGTGFAMKREDLPFASPETQGKVRALPNTEEFTRNATEQYPDDVFSPESASYFRNMHIEGARREREDERQRLTAETKTRALQKQTVAALQVAEQENQKTIDEFTLKLEALKTSKSQTEVEVEQLTTKISRLELDLTEMETKVKEEEDKVQAEKDKKTAIMTASQKALSDWKDRLNDSRSQIAELKTQRDQLESTKNILTQREQGLLRQVELLKTGLFDGAKPVAVSSVTTAGGGIIPTVPSDPLVTSSVTTTSSSGGIGLASTLPASKDESEIKTEVVESSTTSKPAGGGIKIKKTDLRAAAGDKEKK